MVEHFTNASFHECFLAVLCAVDSFYYEQAVVCKSAWVLSSFKDILLLIG